jgi:hypothetical protein
MEDLIQAFPVLKQNIVIFMVSLPRFRDAFQGACPV